LSAWQSCRDARSSVTALFDFIVTYNKRDFRGAERFGLRVVTPKESLEEIDELS
jgi:hypothetical protein